VCSGCFDSIVTLCPTHFEDSYTVHWLAQSVTHESCKYRNGRASHKVMDYLRAALHMHAPSLADSSQAILAVVICTRSCPSNMGPLVRSALTNFARHGMVIVVDQSAASEGNGPADFAHDSRVVHVRDRGVGLARARNIGTAKAMSAGATFVAFTDDDCTPTSGWLDALVQSLRTDPGVGLVFGRTIPGPLAGPDAVIPSYSPPREALYRGLASKPRVEGMGACMAIRVDAWRSVGGFDECLGAGTALASADENDLCMRLLRAGFAVAETPHAAVVHHGVRHGRSVDDMVAGYMRGTGAASAKMVRLCGHSSVRPLAAIAWRWLCGGTAVDTGPATRRWQRLRHFLRGAAIGLTMPLDRRTGRFRRDAPASHASP
jgi:GT2 family glycosyltransferase